MIFSPREEVTDKELNFLSLFANQVEMAITIANLFENLKKEAVTGAVWCLSVMDKNGAVIVPQPKENTGLLANRVLALWPYTEMTDPRIFWGDHYIALRQNPEIAKSIKFGINNTAGKIAYVNHGQALVKSYAVNHPNGIYPDYGCSCEAYACDLFTEAESLSEMKTLKKGEQILHEETWTLIPDIAVDAFSNESLDTLAEKIF